MRPCGDFSPSFGNIPVPIISLVHLLLVVTVVTIMQKRCNTVQENENICNEIRLTSAFSASDNR